MLRRIKETPSPYGLRKTKSKPGCNPGAKVSNWERARDNIPFSVQHRYGTLVKTYSGVLHLVSLFYANFRDADARGIAVNVEVARGLIALGNAVLEKAKDFGGSENAGYQGAESLKATLIADLLNEYSKGAKTGICISVPDENEED